MQGDRLIGSRIGRFDDDRQVFVFDLDQLGGVLRLIFRLGDDQSHRLADEANAFMRQRRPERIAQRAAADALEESHCRRALPPGCDDIGAGEDTENAVSLARGFGIDPDDLGVGPIRPQEICKRLSSDVVIGRVLSTPGQQPVILPAALVWLV